MSLLTWNRIPEARNFPDNPEGKQALGDCMKEVNRSTMGRSMLFLTLVALAGLGYAYMLWTQSRIGLAVVVAIASNALGIAALRYTGKRLRLVVRRRLLEMGFCPTCGYGLTANVRGVCPECGERIQRAPLPQVRLHPEGNP